jgi:hypothetical protein
MLRKDKRSCALCGKTVASGECNNGIVEIFDDGTYAFDRVECVLMFKKFRSVYGPTLFSTC